jgi:outer membrane autotransporter protein
MSVRPYFAVSPLARMLKLATLAPLLFIAPASLAETIDGTEKTIGASEPVKDYLVRNAGTLTANDASTKQIRVESGSTIALQRTQVIAEGNRIGIDLGASSATIAQSKVVSSTTGLSLGRTSGVPSQATVSSSEIIGAKEGAALSAQSHLILQASSTVTGTNADSVGIISFGGKISATDSTITGGRNGISLFADGNMSADNSLILDKSRVEGINGSAILINGQTQTNDERVNIQVNNGSTLVGGNGTLLEVTNGAGANFKVDNSQLVGDIVVQEGSSADVVLDHSATLTGRLENVQSLAVNNDARWVMVGDGQVRSLTLNGGGVQFGQPGEFFKLSVETLAGEGGTFYMHKDFNTGEVDTLTVTGTASGNHLIALDASGTEPVGAGSTPVVHIGGGDASFALQGGGVDLGAFSYNLIKRGDNDWYLDTASRVISPGTQSVIALFNAAPTVWYGELSTLRSRMGEVRRDHGKAGGWIRTYGNKFDIDASAGVAYKQTQQGLSFGADAPLPMGDGQWLFGVLAGYSQSDLDMSRGTTGEVDSYYLGAYTTWLDDQSGYYFDGVLKYNRMQNESKVALSDGTKTKGSYDTNGAGASVEFGRHIRMGENFIEPYAQLAGVVFQGKSYDLDNGLTADGDRSHSLLGKLGVTLGRDISLGEGKVLQPYVRAAYVHEFANNNDVEVNGNPFNNDISGSRGELGTGVAMTLTDKVSLHADFDYSHGNKIEQPWGANVGMRYSW